MFSRHTLIAVALAFLAGLLLADVASRRGGDHRTAAQLHTREVQIDHTYRISDLQAKTEHLQSHVEQLAKRLDDAGIPP